jgi:GTP-binding protein EngB required for normal cell division
MYKYILDLNLPIVITLSKTDKLNNTEVKKSLEYAREVFFGQEII